MATPGIAPKQTRAARGRPVECGPVVGAGCPEPSPRPPAPTLLGLVPPAPTLLGPMPPAPVPVGLMPPAPVPLGLIDRKSVV